MILYSGNGLERRGSVGRAPSGDSHPVQVRQQLLGLGDGSGDGR